MTNQKTNLVPLTDSDLTNLVAFGNRASMTGAEADTWVELKQRLTKARDATNDDDGVPGIDLDDEDLKPGGTA